MKSVIAALSVIAAAALAGCTTGQAPAPAPTATVTVTAAPPPASAAAPAATSAAAPAPSTAAAAAAPAPVLGQLTGVFAQGQGFGQVQPARIFNGGDPTGLVTQIVWKSWGGAKAVGAGLSEWVGPGQSVATGTPEPVRVAAFHLGTCGGRLMYQAVEWYFPQHGQAFTPGRYQDICTGTYVPAQ